MVENSTDLMQGEVGHPSGFLYVLINHGFPQYIKIGQTSGNPYERAEQLFTTGVPKPFQVLRAYFVSDRIQAEKIIHTSLARFRTTDPLREFFEISFAEVQPIIVRDIGHLIDKSVHPEILTRDDEAQIFVLSRDLATKRQEIARIYEALLKSNEKVERLESLIKKSLGPEALASLGGNE